MTTGPSPAVEQLCALFRAAPDIAGVLALLRNPVVKKQREWLTRNRPDLSEKLERAINNETETAP